jgi:glycosyltransferase involved in cell wall biosynthesis
VRLIDDNPHPKDEISRRFAAMDVYLAAIAEGVSTRRTSMMAALEHAVAVVATAGAATDPVLRRADGEGLVLAPAESPGAFGEAAAALAADPARRAAVARGGRELFDREFAWPRHVDRLAGALGLAGGAP